jgi:capsular polysaccharide biosynthesis protein
MSNRQNLIKIAGFFNMLKKGWLGILLWTVMGVVLAWVFSTFLITPKYSATTDILVNQKANDSEDQVTTQQADLQVINTYKDVLKKDIIMKDVHKKIKEEDNYNGKIQDLQNSISVENQSNSQIISISATDDNPYISADISNMTAQVFTERIKKMMKVDNVTIVSKAMPQSKPVSPNKTLNSLLGMLIGLIIGLSIIILRSLFNNTVTSEQFLTDDLGLVNLGMVNHMREKTDLYNVVYTKKSEKLNSKVGPRKRV